MHHRRLRVAAASLVLLPTATRADIISPDFCAALPKRRVEQRPVAHAELRMQLIEQSDEILGECLWGKFIDPEEAPFTLSPQHFGEPVKSVTPLAGVDHDVCYSKPGLQGVPLYLQRPAVTFCGSPAAAKDILEASKPEVIDNILGILSDRRLEFCHHLWRGPRLPPVIHVHKLHWAFALRTPPISSERDQGGHHLHVGFSGELEICRLSTGGTAEIVANEIGRSSLARTRHDGLDLVTIDIAAPLAFERQSYGIARAAEIAGGAVRLVLKNALSMLPDALADILEIIGLSSRQDTQPIETFVDNGLLAPELRRKQVDCLLVGRSLSQCTPPLMIVAKQLLEALNGESASRLTTNLL